MALNDLQGRYIGVVLEGFLYGIYFLLLVSYARLEERRKKAGQGKGAIIRYAVYSLAVLCFTSFALDAYQQYQAVVNGNGDSMLVLNINLATSVLYGFIEFTSQGVLVYRCWVIWQKRIIVVLVPIILMLAALCGILALVHGLRIANQNPLFVITWTFPVGLASFVLSLSVNAIVTFLIVFKIWRVAHAWNKIASDDPENADNNDKQTQYLKPVMSVLVESGLITFVGQLVTVVTFVLPSAAPFNIIIPCVTALYGLTPTILVLRLIPSKPYVLTDESEETRLKFASNNMGQSVSGGEGTIVAVRTKTSSRMDSTTALGGSLNEKY